MNSAHLADQLAHILRTGATCRLVGHGADPLHQTGFKQTTQAHQHQAYGAVAADVVFHAARYALLDNILIHRVENNNGVVFHAQGAGRIDPITLPASNAQFREHLIGVIAALAADDGIQSF